MKLPQISLVLGSPRSLSFLNLVVVFVEGVRKAPSRSGDNSRGDHMQRRQQRQTKDVFASKSGGKKSTTTPQTVCLLEGMVFDLEGPADVPLQGPNQATVSSLCLAESANFFAQCAIGSPQDIVDAAEASQECLASEAAASGIVFSDWWFNRDVMGDHGFETTPSIDNDGSLRVSVPILDPDSKGYFEYLDPELQDRPVSELTGITFDYYLGQCPQQQDCDMCAGGSGTNCSTAASGTCTNHVYVNIFTRSDPSDEVFCDCKYSYSLTQLGASSIEGAWNTVSFNPLTTPNSALNPGTPSNCEVAVSCPPTLLDAAQAGYVLSSKLSYTPPNPPPPLCSFALALQFNVGSTQTCSDAGMIVNFDNIRIDFPFEDGTGARVFNFEAVS